MSSILLKETFELQIMACQDYINRFESKPQKNVLSKSARGKIYDCNNKELATNILSYSLTFEDNGSYENSRQKNLTLNGIAYQVLQILKKRRFSFSLPFISFLTKTESMPLMWTKDLLWTVFARTCSAIRSSTV